MGKKECLYCKEMQEEDFGVYDKGADQFECYNCVEHCTICKGTVPQMDLFSCDYEDENNGVACNNHFHNDCGTYDGEQWFCDDHK